MGFLYFPYSGLINAAAALVVGFFVLSKNYRSPLNRAYAFFAVCVAFWAANYFIWLMSKEYTTALFFIRLTMIGAIFIPAAFIYFVTQFVEKKRFWIHVFNIALIVVFLALSYSPLYIQRVEQRLFFPFWPVPGILFHFMLAYFVFGLVYAHTILWKAWKREEGTKKEQIKYILFGIMTGFVGGCTNYFLWYNIPFPPYLNILVSGFVVFVAYAIVKHQLMNIDVLIKKTLIFASLFAVVFGMFISITLLTQSLIAGNRFLGLAISSVIIILTVRRIENFLVNITDKYLFQKKYNYKDLLKTFTTEVLTVLELDKLVNLTVDKLTDIVKMRSAAVLLFDDEKQQFNVKASQNINDLSVTLARPDGMLTFMDETHGYILVSELKEKNISIPDSIREITDKLNAELIIPMVLHEDVIGVLSLGKKKSDENYSQDDLDILLPLAKTLAIAISNAELFVELGRAQAEASQREKLAVIGTLSAGINHEICNPLGIARGQCEAFLLNLKDGLYKTKTDEELIEKAKGIMAKVIKETDRATAITKKLSGFAKPSKGEAEIVHIDKEVDEVFGLVGYELRLEKIEFDKRIQKDIPDLFVDKKQFQEVLFNLIRNAGQAIGDKGRITVTAKEEDGKIFIDVQDTGAGIPEDKIKLLFNPFFTTKDPGKGTGLGLFIVRQVVEKNGGKIYLKDTKVGEGTTFRVEFPIAAKERVKVSK